MEVEPRLYPSPSQGRWVLAHDWPFRVGEHEFTIPAGYTTDGASIPRFWWRVTYSPWDPVVMTAALEHDYLCDQRPASVDSAAAARHFRDRLTHAGATRREAMYRAVLYFGPKWGK